MKEIIKELDAQQVVALKKKHWETTMLRNRYIFMFNQHSEDIDDSWLNSEECTRLEEEYENAFVEETLFREGLVDIVLGVHVCCPTYYIDQDNLLHINVPDNF